MLLRGMRRGGLVVDVIGLIPPVNTLLVAIVGILLIVGVRNVRRGRIRRHRRFMISATGLFALFLTLYAVRMVVHGPTYFAVENPTAPEAARVFYYAFLFAHMGLAVATVGLIPVVLYRALTRQYARHKRLARWVYPMWLVSIVMGIVVYFMLFEIW